MRERPSNCGARHRGLEVILGPRLVADLDLGPGEGGLDQQPYLVQGDRPSGAGLAPCDGPSISSTRQNLTRGRPLGSPAALLGGVDRLPAGVGDVLGLALVEQGLDLAAVAASFGSGMGAGRRGPGEDRLRVSWESFLFVPITPRRAALDPAGCVQAGDWAPSSPVTRAVLVRRSHRGPRRRGRPVERLRRGSRSSAAPGRTRSPRARRCRGADGARPVLAGARCAPTTMRSTLPSPWISIGELRKLSTMRCFLPSGSRFENSVKISTLRSFVGSESSESISAWLISSSSISAGSMSMSACGHLAELADLGVGECRLRGAAAAQHDDLLHAALGERLDRVVGGVGGLSSSRGRASMRATSAATLPLPITTTRSAEVEVVVGEVRMRVVPIDELGGRMASRAGPRRGSRDGGRSRCRRRRGRRRSARAARRRDVLADGRRCRRSGSSWRAAVFS